MPKWPACLFVCLFVCYLTSILTKHVQVLLINQMPNCHPSILHPFIWCQWPSILLICPTEVSKVNPHSSHCIISCIRAHIHTITLKKYLHISLSSIMTPTHSILALINQSIIVRQTDQTRPNTPNKPTRYPVSFSSEPDRQNSQFACQWKNNRKVERKIPEAHISLCRPTSTSPYLSMYPSKEPISGLIKKRRNPGHPLRERKGTKQVIQMNYLMISWKISSFNCSLLRVSLTRSNSKKASGIGAAVGSSSGSW